MLRTNSNRRFQKYFDQKTRPGSGQAAREPHERSAIPGGVGG
jgi:hypothetical protein